VLKLFITLLVIQFTTNLFSLEPSLEKIDRKDEITHFPFTQEESHRWMQLYLDHKNDEVTELMLQKILQIESCNFWVLNDQDRKALDSFVSTLFYIFGMDDYSINPKYWNQLITLNATAANIIAASSFKTPDLIIPNIFLQQNNIAKLLFFYSSKSSIVLDYKKLFSVNNIAASYWYIAYLSSYVSNCSDSLGFENLKRHIAQCPDRFHACSFYHRSAAFSSTYIDPNLDQNVKKRINHLIQDTFSSIEKKIVNTPNKKKIAILSDNWRPCHSVYRNQYPYLKELAKYFDLTLIIFTNKPDIDFSLFKDVKCIELTGENSIDLSPILSNEYVMAYYPDIGMTWESVILSNLKIAPIQVTTYGHSVSTYGSKIDYWIGGKDVELLDYLKENYSEKVLLIPGLGITNTLPYYELKNIAIRKEKFIVNCCWSMQKINYDMVMVLKKIADHCNKLGTHVVFRFFLAEKGSEFLGVSFTESITKYLGDHIEIYPYLPYKEYMETMEEARFSIDSFHFGGCNTVVDNLHIKKPIITIEGTKWYNRIGAGLLRKVGLNELIVKNEEEYFNKICECILSPKLLEQITNKVKLTDMSPLYNDQEAVEGFVKVIKKLINEL